MIDRQRLLTDLQRILRTLEADLIERADSRDVPEVGETLRKDYAAAKQAERTAQNYTDWLGDYATQMAAAWVLSCVFARFLEDNALVEPPKLAGPGERLKRARDEHELYFRQHPTLTDREYLLDVFDRLQKLPGGDGLFGEHNPIRELPNWLSGDAAGTLLTFFQTIDANSGDLLHDFTDEEWDTRFLGDLYQDLSEAARKKYALLQTPEFVEEFILDRTLDPALDEFGLIVHHGGTEDTEKEKEKKASPCSPCLRGEDLFRMIDPACGSGHFLLGAFDRILDRWQKQEPGTNVRELARRTLESVTGVDLNPYAAAIARFRLLLAAMRACGITRLVDAPDFRPQVYVGDSLLHGRGEQLSLGWRDYDHAYHGEDVATLRRVLTDGRYHAVVANPPYITPKDRALNAAYRERYASCHMKYSLAVPFMERLFRLAVSGQPSAVSQRKEAESRQLRADGSGAAGFVGQITANSFMKREFGKKLIEQVLPRLDLTHVIDSQLAHIPGHGTPHTIIFGRNRPPVSSTIRLIGAIKRENEEPADPSRGLVWSAIVDQVDQPGSQSEFVSVGDTPREAFGRHPWSIGGGGAAELKEQLDETGDSALGTIAAAIGITAVTGEDELFMQPATVLRRHRIEAIRPLVEGDVARDWAIADPQSSVWLYGEDLELASIESLPNTAELFWKYRAAISRRRRFGTPMIERGLTWFEWQELYRDKLRTPLSLVFAEVATHNHFVLDRGGKVFKQTAPVIKLPADATEDDHFALLGLLNSSTACFWLKQVCHCKGGGGIGGGIAAEAWERFYAINGSKLLSYPLPSQMPTANARTMLRLTGELAQRTPPAIADRWDRGVEDEVSLHVAFRHTHPRWAKSLGRMIWQQEELDWECYRLYGLTGENLTIGGKPIALELGERAFEIVLARKMAAGELQTTWFDRHGSTPITELPARWPEEYRRLVERRIALIESDQNIGLIEQPEYKRRWNTEPWESQVERVLKQWLLARLESYFDFDGRMQEVHHGDTESTEEGTARDNSVSSVPPWSKPPLAEIQLVSLGRLADVAGQDERFLEVGTIYRDDAAFDVARLVAELVDSESVPLLPVLRYKETGLRKRAAWEQTWELQREEDRLESEGRGDGEKGGRGDGEGSPLVAPSPRLDIPVPPKYTSADFLKSDYWRLRGKLDVPKERWVSFPHCEGPDGTAMIAWAGYDHLQLAQAISAYYVDVQERLGGRDDPRLAPLLAGLIELLPWLKQWHNEVDPEFGLPMGDYFKGFVEEEARGMGKTVEEIKAWQPPARATRRGRRARR